MEELVRVKNLGDKPFVGIYQAHRTVIAPGEEAAFVRSEAVILWFGNPDAIDHYKGDDLHEDRTREVSRMDTRYGVFPTRAGESDLTREDQWPKVKVMSMDGSEIRMVIHDPEGVAVTPATETVSERRALMETIDDLKARVERYEAQVAVPEAPDVAEDSPPTGRARGRAV